MTADRRAKTASLVFVNSDAKPKVSTVLCARTSVPQIMAWYGAYYAGDRYYVQYDGKRLEKDHNGELIP